MKPIAARQFAWTRQEIADHDADGNAGFAAKIYALGPEIVSQTQDHIVITAAGLAKVTGMDLLPSAEVPRAQWPWAARMIALCRIDCDIGVGDVVARFTHATAIDKAVHGFYHAANAVQWLAKRLPPCGCGDRRARWNAQYPFNPPTPNPASSPAFQTLPPQQH